MNFSRGKRTCTGCCISKEIIWIARLLAGVWKLKGIRNKTLLTYLLTPLYRVLLENLTGFQPVKKFPVFYGTRRFITAFTSARHLFLSEPARSSPYPRILLPEDPSWYYPPIYAWVSQVVSFPQVSPRKPCISLSSPPYKLHAPPVSFFSIFTA